MRVVESLASEKQVWSDKITSAAINNICRKAMIKIMYYSSQFQYYILTSQNLHQLLVILIFLHEISDIHRLLYDLGAIQISCSNLRMRPFAIRFNGWLLCISIYAKC